MTRHPQDFIDSQLDSFASNKRLAERAVSQVDFDCLRQSVSPGTNSIAVIMKHVAGNLRSRWTDFLTTDGEKPWRDRDTEFVDDFQSREELIAFWQSGWECLFGILESLSDADLQMTIAIRGEPHSVALAMSRSLGHTSYHVGQIVMLARHFAGDQWQTLTIPRGESEKYNRENWGRTGKSHS